MKITSIEIIPASKYLFVKIYTDEGIHTRNWYRTGREHYREIPTKAEKYFCAGGI